MVPYFLLAAGATISSKIGSLPGFRLLGQFALPIVLLVAFSGLRYGVGTDFELYEWIFAAVDPESLAGSAERIPQEWGFVALMYIVRQFTDSYQVFLAVCAALTVIPVLLAIKRISPMPTLSIFLYITLAYYPTSLNAIRQSIAVSFVLLAESYRSEKKWVWLLFNVLAVLFHASSVLATMALLVVRLLRVRLTSFLLVALAVGVLGAGALQFSIVQDVLNSLSERYIGYLDSELGAGAGTYLVLCAHLVIALFCVIAVGKQQLYRVHKSPYIAYYAMSSMILLLATTNWVIGRLEPYFGTFVIIALPIAVAKLRHRAFWVGGLALASLAYFAMHISFYNDLVPYVSIFGS